MLLDIFALLVIGVLIAAVIWLVAVIGPIPGNIAARRGHHQADAIRVLGWIGILTLGPAWLAALVWAYMRPVGTAGLAERVAVLEEEVRALKDADGGSPP